MSRLNLFFLGPPRIETDGAPIKMDNRKTTALLAYLAVTGERHRRDSLLNLLWPDYDQTRARNVLRQNLYALNKALAGDCLDVDRETIRLNPNADIWLDVDEFHNYLSECRTHGHPSTEVCPNCIKPLTKAVELYQDEFLKGFSLQDSVNFDDWQFSQAHSLHSEMVNALERLVACLSQQGQFEEAIAHCQRWLELDRTNEAAHRHLMESCARTGRRAAALRQYEECVKVLKNELATSPQEETTKLYEAIKENAFSLKREVKVTEVPPLKSLDIPKHNLPVQLTSFIGREREIEEVKQLLNTTHLLTLTGSGGCGKTRLALQVAADLVGDFKDGVWFVELASLSDPVLVPQKVASALGISEQSGLPISDALSDYLRQKQIILVLDNCEHLIDACASLAENLLRACPNLRMLTTSRQTLEIAGETSWRVPSLSLPDPEHEGTAAASDLMEYEAVKLFIDRAGAALPGFIFADRNAQVVAQICYRLDGIPLAIELATARVKVLTVEQISSRLDDRFRLLTGGIRSALPRQKTLRAMMDWSYNLLSEEERLLLNRLPVFAGGWSLSAVEGICAGDGIEGYEVLDLVGSLVDKSLVVVEEVSSTEEGDGEARYSLLETVREYASEKLEESGGAEALRGHHADFFQELAQEAEPELHGPDHSVWLDRLEKELDNMRAALAWGKRREGREEGWMRTAVALWWFWFVRGYLSEGRKWLEGVVEENSGASVSLRSKALFRGGSLSFSQGDYRQAAEMCEESLTLSREIGDKLGVAWSLSILGTGSWFQGDEERAMGMVEESLALSREIGDKFGIAITLGFKGMAAQKKGDYRQASEMCEESLALFREIGYKGGIAAALRLLGGIALNEGDYERGQALGEESLALCRETGSKPGVAFALLHLGRVAKYRGDYRQAAEMYEESLTLSQELGTKGEITECLEELGEVAVAQGQPDRGGRLFGAAEALREEMGNPIRVHERSSDYDQRVAAARAELGEEAFAEEWEEGRAMTIEEAIDYVLTVESG